MKEQSMSELSFGSKEEISQYLDLKKELQANIYAVQKEITEEAAKMLRKVMGQIEQFSNSIEPKFKKVVEKAENLLGRLHFLRNFEQSLKQLKAAKIRLDQQHKFSKSIIKSAVNSHQFLSENQLSNLKRIMKEGLSQQQIIASIKFFIWLEQKKIKSQKECSPRNQFQLPQSQKKIFEYKIKEFQRKIQMRKTSLKNFLNFLQSNDLSWFKKQNQQFKSYKSKLSSQTKTHNASILPKDQTLKGKPETKKKLSYGINTNNSNQDQIIQNYLKNDDLATIYYNIKLDYPGQFSAENIQNVLEIYQKAYQFNSFEIRNKTYWKQKKKMEMQMQKQKQKFSVQLQILKWMEQCRGIAIKFDGTQIPGSNFTYGLNNSDTKSQKIVIPKQFMFCQNTYFLKSYRFKDIKQLQGKKPYKFQKWKHIQFNAKSKYQNREVMMNKGKEFILKTVPNGLFQYDLEQKYNNKSLNANWVGEMTQDGRTIWRASIKIDKEDVEKLLRYLLTQTQDLEECPSIVINTGSHGDQFGQNVQQGSDATLIDQRIVREMYQIIQQLLQEGKHYGRIKDHKIHKNEKILCQKMLINQKNIKHKILINSLKIQKGGEYPYQADHIIDTQCKGASTLVKKQFLYTIQDIQDIEDLNYRCSDLIFNFNSEEEIMQRFNGSKIIKNNSILKKLKALFSPYIIQNARLLFNSQLFSRRLQSYQEQVFHQNNLLIIIKTENNQVIGAYSPLSFSLDQYEYRNKKSPNPYFNKSWETYVRDPERKSFLFSLNQTQNYKFTLTNTNKAIQIAAKFGDVRIFGRQQFFFFPIYKFIQSSFQDSIWNDRAYDCECLNKQFQKYQQENINKPNKMTRQQYYNDKILGRTISQQNCQNQAQFKAKCWQIWKITLGQQLNKDVEKGCQTY